MEPFSIARVITKTNTLYRELRANKQEYCGDFMGRTLDRDYTNAIYGIWREVRNGR